MHNLHSYMWPAARHGDVVLDPAARFMSRHLHFGPPYTKGMCGDTERIVWFEFGRPMAL